MEKLLTMLEMILMLMAENSLTFLLLEAYIKRFMATVAITYKTWKKIRNTKSSPLFWLLLFAAL